MNVVKKNPHHKDARDRPFNIKCPFLSDTLAYDLLKRFPNQDFRFSPAEGR